jgi:hypothetical protein
MERETKSFEVLNLDVWGNENEGYEVNQAFNTGKFIEMTLDQYESDEFIIMSLIDMDFLTHEAIDKVNVDGDGQTLYINDDRTSKPLYQLQMI